MDKIYVLQKDLPGVKAGTEYINHPKAVNRWYPDNCYEHGKLILDNLSIHGLITSDIVDNPDFFKLKQEDKIEVEEICVRENSFGYGTLIKTSQPIPSEKYLPIKKAIEFVLQYNDHPLKDSIGNHLYTQDMVDSLEQAAFENSRLTHPMVGFKYDTFSDYKNTTNANP